jgi:hypothetical protein
MNSDRPTPTVPMFAHEPHIAVGNEVQWYTVRAKIVDVHYDPRLMERRVDLELSNGAKARGIHSNSVKPITEKAA